MSTRRSIFSCSGWRRTRSATACFTSTGCWPAESAMASRRQPGSVFKPFVYLTAFEEAAAHGRTDITPATIVDDQPETFEFDDQVWTPENYEKTYDGPITYRQALAQSKNLATIHVAQGAGYDNI